MSATAHATKAQVRAQVLAARRALGPAEHQRAGLRMTRLLLDLEDLGTARCVAAYLSFGTEPSTAEFLDRLRSEGIRVLVPVLREDLDLDWAIYVGPHGVARDEPGPPRPTGPLLGVDALAEADVVVVPALAVGADGTRLGRGGGSYDRALARVPAGRPVVTLLYDGELLPAVPTERHDRRVDVVVAPAGVHRFGQAVGSRA